MITEDHAKELDLLLKRCLDNDDQLSEWENSFVSDFVDRLGKYGEKLNLSPKQQAVLDRIDEKLKKAGV